MMPSRGALISSSLIAFSASVIVFFALSSSICLTCFSSPFAAFADASSFSGLVRGLGSLELELTLLRRPRGQ